MKKRILKVLDDMIERMKSFGSTEMIPQKKEWKKEVIRGKVTSPSFRSFIENQVSYWMPKDREYAKFLENLLG